MSKYKDEYFYEQIVDDAFKTKVIVKRFTDFVVENRRLEDPKEILIEVLLGLSSEVGEVLDLYKKQLRDKRFTKEELHDKVKDEVSDLLHYIFSLLEIESLGLIEVIEHNMNKIEERYKTNPKKIAVGFCS